MSQRDLVAELRLARTLAPAAVRDRVRLVAAGDPSARSRRVTWRRSLVVLVPVAAAIAAAVIVTRPAHKQAVVYGVAVQSGAVRALDKQSAAVPAPLPSRVQRYGADLSLRVASPTAVSDGVKRALQIVASLGGHPVSVHESAANGAGSADLVLKVPRLHVQAAVARLSQLGTIVGEQVDVQDLTAGINAGDRTIARLQHQLAALRAQPQTDAVKRQIAALTARVVALQRARASTVATAHFATVSLSLSTTAAVVHHGHGPLHGLSVAFRWIGIGLVYGLALGVPLALVLGLIWFAVRTVLRRREERLLADH